MKLLHWRVYQRKSNIVIERHIKHKHINFSLYFPKCPTFVNTSLMGYIVYI